MVSASAFGEGARLVSGRAVRQATHLHRKVRNGDDVDVGRARAAPLRRGDSHTTTEEQDGNEAVQVCQHDELAGLCFRAETARGDGGEGGVWQALVEGGHCGLDVDVRKADVENLQFWPPGFRSAACEVVRCRGSRCEAGRREERTQIEQ